jgi:hypothetical protein
MTAKVYAVAFSFSLTRLARECLGDGGEARFLPIPGVLRQSHPCR